MQWYKYFHAFVNHSIQRGKGSNPHSHDLTFGQATKLNINLSSSSVAYKSSLPSDCTNQMEVLVMVESLHVTMMLPCKYRYLGTDMNWGFGAFKCRLAQMPVRSNTVLFPLVNFFKGLYNFAVFLVVVLHLEKLQNGEWSHWRECNSIFLWELIMVRSFDLVYTVITGWNAFLWYTSRDYQWWIVNNRMNLHFAVTRKSAINEHSFVTFASDLLKNSDNLLIFCRAELVIANETFV